MKRLTTYRADGRAAIANNENATPKQKVLKIPKVIDRLRELAQADREGISPCTFCRFNPPSSGDGKPCCMCPAEAALRRERDG